MVMIETKATSIAPTLAANFNPSVAPLPSASIAFSVVLSIEIATLSKVSGLFVSG